MATAHNEKRNGKTYRRIAVNVYGQVKRINCGILPQKAFNVILGLVDEIEGLKAVGGQIDETLKTRLEKITPKIKEQLTRVGLLRQPKSIPRFSEFAAEFVSQKLAAREIKPRTARAYRGIIKVFVECVGDLKVNEITEETINTFKAERSKNAASSTVGTDLKRVKGVIRHAIKKKWLADDPFADVIIPAQILEPEKVDAQDALLDAQALDHLMDSSPNLEWRILISIIRWTGCRLAEALILRWDDILWDTDEIKMRSPKTVKNKKSVRIMPLWQHLKHDLNVLWDATPDGTGHILNGILNLSEKPEFEISDPVTGEVIREGRYETNAQTTFKKIIERAGLEVWPQPFHAIRGFRRNELERSDYRATDIDAWLGHDARTAARHYSRSSQKDRQRAAVDPNSGCGEIVVARCPRTASDRPTKNPKPFNSPKKQRSESQRGDADLAKVHPIGFEPITSGSVDRCSIQLS